MDGIFYIQRYTKNSTEITGYFKTFEDSHDILLKSRQGNYDEEDTTGNIYFQPFGINQRAILVCSRHGDFDIIEDYYNEAGKRVRTLRYKKRIKTTSQSLANDTVVKRHRFGY